jgi:hypothetical protein
MQQQQQQRRRRQQRQLMYGVRSSLTPKNSLAVMVVLLILCELFMCYPHGGLREMNCMTWHAALHCDMHAAGCQMLAINAQNSACSDIVRSIAYISCSQGKFHMHLLHVPASRQGRELLQKQFGSPASLKPLQHAN